MTDKQIKIVFTVGGTGGHVYPAVAVANQLRESIPSLDFLFIGGKLATNKYLNDLPISYRSTSCGMFKKKNPIEITRNCFSIVKGMWQSRRLLQEYKPDLVVGFGSYHTLPVLLAAKWLGYPLVLHEANSIPGKVNRLMAPYARITGVHFPLTASLLKGKTAEVGMPLRHGFKKGFHTREEACAYFKLDPKKAVLLVFGGSQGAQALNALAGDAAAKEWGGGVQVLHITGNSEATGWLRRAYAEKGVAACVKEFEGRMDFAWEVADLALARAGAGTIAEAMEFEVPAILVPFPQAADKHQDRNAEFMANTVGGAALFQESALKPAILKECVDGYFVNGREKIERARQSIRTYKLQARTRDFCEIIQHLIHH